MQHKLSDIVVPKFDLTGKTAIITGGTKGLGYGMAVTFASYGANVVVAARTTEDCRRVEGELRSLGVKSLGIPTDVTKSDQVDKLIETTVSELGKVDIMVANAGQSATYKAVDLPEEEWDRVIDVDLKGVFLSARAAARQMIKQGTGGRIINTSSAAGLKGSISVAAYCAAKAGVVNLTKALSLEWARYGITVNCICPGYVLTSINEAKLSDPDVIGKIVKFSSMRRLGKIEEIASAALFLASDYSGYMTGTHMLIDGGGGAK